MEKLFKQIGDEVIEYTETDYAQAEIDLIENDRINKELADQAAVKQAAKAELLSKLGITEDEARLLLG